MSFDEGDTINSSPLYRDKPDWKDVEPIYPSADEEKAVKIAFSEQFRDAFAYLRAIMRSQEMSERALMLTEDCIQLNPANYSLWLYRRDLLKHLKVDLGKEMRYLEEIINETPKNYQVWHHRRALVEWMGGSGISAELAFTDMVLHDESKNYHAWQHRQWVVRTFPSQIDHDLELSFALKMIMEDPRNNSAWNYRYYILQNKNALSDPKTLEVEINLCKRLIEKMPHNESIWNYLAGLSINDGLLANEDVVKFAEDLYERTEADKRAPYLISFVADIFLERIEKGIESESSCQKAKELYEELVKTDPVRSNYWKHQQKYAENLLQKQSYKTVAK